MSIKNIRKVLLFLMLLFLVAYSYIWISTFLINENSYKKLTQKIMVNIYKQNLEDYIVKVEIERIEKSIDFMTPAPPEENDRVIKLNKVLMKLNGYRAVRVEYVTKVDSVVGGPKFFVNPFTKQIIGEMLGE